MNETIIRKYRYFFEWQNRPGAGSLTMKGKLVLAEQVRRLEIMSRNGQAIRPQL